MSNRRQKYVKYCGETPAANSQCVCEGRYRNGIGQSAELLPEGLDRNSRALSHSLWRCDNSSSTVGFQRLNGCGSIHRSQSSIFGLRYSLLPIERWSPLVVRGAATKRRPAAEMPGRCRWYKGTMTLLNKKHHNYFREKNEFCSATNAKSL